MLHVRLRPMSDRWSAPRRHYARFARLPLPPRESADQSTPTDPQSGQPSGQRVLCVSMQRGGLAAAMDKHRS